MDFHFQKPTKPFSVTVEGVEQPAFGRNLIAFCTDEEYVRNHRMVYSSMVYDRHKKKQLKQLDPTSNTNRTNENKNENDISSICVCVHVVLANGDFLTLTPQQYESIYQKKILDGDYIENNTLVPAAIQHILNLLKCPYPYTNKKYKGYNKTTASISSQNIIRKNIGHTAKKSKSKSACY
jgi:hypothetical protein